MDRFFKTCLVLIVLLLTVIACEHYPLQSVHAAETYEYDDFNASGTTMPDLLTKASANGYDFVSISWVQGLGSFLVVVRKPVSATPPAKK
jgi:hypothetical protein